MSESPVSVYPSPLPLQNRWLRPELVSPWAEFLGIAALLLALPIWSSTRAALKGSSTHFVQLLLTDNHLLWSIVGESVLLAFFLVYLKWRGWKPADLNIGLHAWTSLQGVALFFLTEAAVFLTVFELMGVVFAFQSNYTTFYSFMLAFSPHIAPHSIQLSWPVIVVAMVVNAFLEEIMCMAYIFNQLAARCGPSIALIGTVFLRVACHTYQDPIHLVGIAVLFSIYAAWYWYVGKLWPLIFAHILLDVGSISFFKAWFS